MSNLTKFEKRLYAMIKGLERKVDMLEIALTGRYTINTKRRMIASNKRKRRK